MKKIIKLTETDLTRIVKGIITEDRFSTLTHYIDMLEDVLDNYDSIDCENINRKYERFYCENIGYYSKEKVERALENFKKELAGLMYNEFNGSGLFGG